MRSDSRARAYVVHRDSLVVKKNYVGMDPHDIVLDIIENFTPAGAGFTTDHVQVGGFPTKGHWHPAPQTGAGSTRLSTCANTPRTDSSRRSALRTHFSS